MARDVKRSGLIVLGLISALTFTLAGASAGRKAL